MKILFDHPDPFLLAHGGFQIQIEQTKVGLESAGVQVEYLRWWDDRQHGDIIHYFGRPSSSYIQFAHGKKIKVVIEQLLTGLGSRSGSELALQKWIIGGAKAFLPQMVTARFGWDSFQLADACIANTSWEAQLMVKILQAAPGNVHVLPNGVEPIFLNGVPEERGRWLVCTATITARKRILELAQAAIEARVPLWVIGKAYSETDQYAHRFLELARAQPEFIRYEGPISEREKLAKIYRQARGFVLLSTMETRSLSAEEAAACGCPLLLSNLPWAKSVFKANATYCPISKSTGEAGIILKRFYEEAPRLPIPPKPANWNEVGLQLKSIYEKLLKTSR
ncbi:MAG: glycosyltransferase family 4 protein [Verrucomicrobiota bacterium]